MVVVTTLSYPQLASLIKNARVTLNNEDLLFGEKVDTVEKYIEERLGSAGFVVGISGRINPASASFLSSLDEGLAGERLILEASVNPDDMLVFDVARLGIVSEFISHGFPDEYIEEALDEAVSSVSNESLQAVCVPYIKKEGNLRITSPVPGRGDEINVSQANITFVKLNGGA